MSTLLLQDSHFVGFDLDHTLCRYRLSALTQLCSDAFRGHLVEHFHWPAALLRSPSLAPRPAAEGQGAEAQPQPETPTPTATPAPPTLASTATATAAQAQPLSDAAFFAKGLLFDKKTGHFLRLRADGSLLLASHGRRLLDTAAVAAAFAPGELKELCAALCSEGRRDKRYFYFATYFDMPAVAVAADMVDLVDCGLHAPAAQNAALPYAFIINELLSSLDDAFSPPHFSSRSGRYFPEMIAHTERYVRCWGSSVLRPRSALVGLGTCHPIILIPHRLRCRLFFPSPLTPSVSHQATCTAVQIRSRPGCGRCARRACTCLC